MARFSRRQSSESPETVQRLRVATWVGLAFGALVIGRLFVLMVWDHEVYAAIAVGSHESTAKLVPRRGEIFVQDSRTNQEYPVAINRDVFLVYADTTEFVNKKTDTLDEAKLNETLAALREQFKYTPEREAEVRGLLMKRTDPYEPLEQKIEATVADALRTKKLTGLHFVRQEQRYYPEQTLAASVLGFVGKEKDGTAVGRYGIEGYWEKELAGAGGFVAAARGAKGAWIPLAGRSFQPAQDGADLVLTIDRTLQYRACERLRAGLAEYGATSASLVIMQPQTGAILAMCSLPDFDPNTYGKVDSVSSYNNSAIFTPYEPGSIFKPIAMVAAVDQGVLGPDTPFHDTGRRDGLCSQPIQNAGNKAHGDQTMTGVLLNSINTGMVYVAERLGKEKLTQYIEKFGFGTKTGVTLDTETSGTVDSLHKNKGNKLDCYTATASFGQGLTVTPLQMVTAFSAIANGGRTVTPYIIKEIRYSDGRVERTRPREGEEILTSRATQLLGGMLVKTVDNGYSGRARVPGYFVAGKSGTAEIADQGGYSQTYNHSFIGYAPIDNPRFVMIVKYEKPQRAYAESTAAPVFGELAKFILEYYQVPPERPIK